MTDLNFTRSACLTLIAFCGCLTACSPDGDGTAAAPVAGAGKLNQGPVSQLSSEAVVINGRSFALQDYALLVDGQSGSPADLAPGMLVRAVSSGENRTLSFSPQLSGPITAVHPQGPEVLGQLVRLDEMTSVNTAQLQEWRVGDWVQVSGFRLNDHSLLASQISPAHDRRVQRIGGAARNVRRDLQRFAIGQTEISYGAASLAESMEAVAEGQRLTALGQMGPDQVFVASELRPVAIRPVDGTEVLAYAPAHKPSPDSLSVAGIPVRGADSAQDASSGDVLYENQLVLVEGFMEQGQLTARTLSVPGPRDGVVQAQIEHIDSTQRSVRVLGDYLASVDDQTRLENDGQAGHLDFLDLRIGDSVRLIGMRNADGMQLARLQRLDASRPGRAEIQGRVDRLSPATLSIAVDGVEVALDSLVGSAPHAPFILALELGQWVIVSGIYDRSSQRLLAQDIGNLRRAKLGDRPISILPWGLRDIGMLDDFDDTFNIDVLLAQLPPVLLATVPEFPVVLPGFDSGLTVQIDVQPTGSFTDTLDIDVQIDLEPTASFTNTLMDLRNLPGTNHGGSEFPAEHSGFNFNPDLLHNSMQFGARVGELQFNGTSSEYPAQRSEINLNPDLGLNLWNLGNNAQNAGDRFHGGSSGQGEYPAQRSDPGFNPDLGANLWQLDNRLQERDLDLPVSGLFGHLPGSLPSTTE